MQLTKDLQQCKKDLALEREENAKLANSINSVGELLEDVHVRNVEVAKNLNVAHAN